MKVFSLLLAAMCFLLTSCSTPLYEYEDGKFIRRSSDYLDNLRGANPKRDIEQMKFSSRIIRSAGTKKQDEWNTPYTGNVKIYVWSLSKGRGKYVALREIRWKDGSIGYQGPNPPTYFYGAREKNQIIISTFNPEIENLLKADGVYLYD